MHFSLSKEVSQYFIEQTKQLTKWIEERLRWKTRYFEHAKQFH